MFPLMFVHSLFIFVIVRMIICICTVINFTGKNEYFFLLPQPSWTMYIQVMTFDQAEKSSFNPFDLTKVD